MGLSPHYYAIGLTGPTKPKVRCEEMGGCEHKRLYGLPDSIFHRRDTVSWSCPSERVRIRGVCSQFKGLNIARNCCLVENGIRCPDGGSYPFPSERTIS